MDNKKDSEKKMSKGGKLKFGAFEFIQKDGKLIMTNPDKYESLNVNEPPTKEDYEDVIVDYFQFDSRDTISAPIEDWEVEAINKTFSKEDQKRIFGTTFNIGLYLKILKAKNK